SCCTRKRNSLTEYSRAAAPGYQRFHAWSKAAASYRSLTFRPHLTKTTAPRVANHTQRNRRGGSPACWYAVIQGSQPSMKKSRWKKLSPIDRKSTRLNSSHVKISYAVFCLKKKKDRKQ